MDFRVCVIGPSQSGKSTVCRMLDEQVGGGWADTVDVIIDGLAAKWKASNPDYASAPLPHVADFIRCSYRQNMGIREALFEFAKEAEIADPLFTVAKPLQRGCFVAGTRRIEQLVHMRERVDWVVWLDRPGAACNSTDRLTPDDADMILPNHGGLIELRQNVEAFLRLFGPGTPALAHRREKRHRV